MMSQLFVCSFGGVDLPACWFDRRRRSMACGALPRAAVLGTRRSRAPPNALRPGPPPTPGARRACPATSPLPQRTVCYGRLPRQTRAETSAEPRSDLATVRPACTHSHRRGSLRRALRAAMDDEAIAAPRCVRTAFARLDFRYPGSAVRNFIRAATASRRRARCAPWRISATPSKSRS